MRRAVLTTLSAVFILAPTIALAHTGHGDTSGLMHGFTHPITGIDHVLAMVAVGVLAAQLGGRALWLVPLSFVGVMAVGAPSAWPESNFRLLSSESLCPSSSSGWPLPFGSSAGRSRPWPLSACSRCSTATCTVPKCLLPRPGCPYAAGFVGRRRCCMRWGGPRTPVRLEAGKLGHRLVQTGGGAMALFGIAVLAGFLL